MLGNHSKWIGSIVGGASGLLVARFGLPAELASPEVTAAITTILAAFVTYRFPKNVVL